MPRIRIWTAPDRLTGEAVVEELREAGVPVIGMAPGSDLYPTTPLYDLYLEDESLLDNPVIKRAIADATSAHPLTVEEELQAEQMPFVDPPSSGAASLADRRLKKGNRLYTWLAMLLMAAVLWLALGYLRKMFAGEL